MLDFQTNLKILIMKVGSKLDFSEEKGIPTIKMKIFVFLLFRPKMLHNGDINLKRSPRYHINLANA